jgi:Flp pilus assembly protein TadD
LVDLAELRARCDTRAAETGRLLEWYEAFKRETDGGALGEAEARVRSAPSGAFAEGVVNAVGYSHILRSRDVAKAVAVFEINTRVFPDSANAWDSLAEGLAEAGDRQGAIASYRKSLALNPDNDNAKRMIEKLQSEP